MLQFENRTAPIVIGKSVPDRFLPFNRVLPVRDSRGGVACTVRYVSSCRGICQAKLRKVPIGIRHILFGNGNKAQVALGDEHTVDSAARNSPPANTTGQSNRGFAASML